VYDLAGDVSGPAQAFLGGGESDKPVALRFANQTPFCWLLVRSFPVLYAQATLCGGLARWGPVEFLEIGGGSFSGQYVGRRPSLSGAMRAGLMQQF
jgi:hypothetical protein